MLKQSLVNRIGFGCGKLSVMPTLRSALHILENAFDNGINYFDTAPLYGGGFSEKIVGKFSKSKRDKIFICTKVGLLPPQEYNLPSSFALPLNYIKRKIKKSNTPKNPSEAAPLPHRIITKDYVRYCFEKSLKNLQTDYIDYYFLHEAIPSFLEDKAFEYLLKLKSDGFINKIGLAASYINYMKLDKDEIALFDVLQYEYNPQRKSTIVKEMFPDKKHFLHGILPNKHLINDNIPSQNIAGYMLAQCLKNSFADKVLFATTKLKNLRTNIDSLNLYY